MTAKEVIKYSLDSGRSVLLRYLDDLTDADLMVRPVPAANHIAWQLGHLIVCENGRKVLGHAVPALPAGFEESYTKQTAGADDPARFHKKSLYIRLLGEQRASTLAALAAIPDADLDGPAPEEMRGYAPTIGAMFNMLGIHDMMHAGQFVIVRRKLGKPVLF